MFCERPTLMQYSCLASLQTVFRVRLRQNVLNHWKNILNVLFYRSSQKSRRGSQVVRQGSAKPLFVGSIPTHASKFNSYSEVPILSKHGFGIKKM